MPLGGLLIVATAPIHTRLSKWRDLADQTETNDACFWNIQEYLEKDDMVLRTRILQKLVLFDRICCSMLRSFQEVAFEYARAIEKPVARFLVERCGGERTCSAGLNCLSPGRRRYKWLTPRHGPRGGDPVAADLDTDLGEI